MGERVRFSPSNIRERINNCFKFTYSYDFFRIFLFWKQSYSLNRFVDLFSPLVLKFSFLNFQCVKIAALKLTIDKIKISRHGKVFLKIKGRKIHLQQSLIQRYTKLGYLSKKKHFALNFFEATKNINFLIHIFLSKNKYTVRQGEQNNVFFSENQSQSFY